MQSIQILPCFSLEPNKLVLFNRVFKSSNYDENGNLKPKTKRLTKEKFADLSNDKTVERSSHSMQLSDNAYRTLKKKINWLYYLAKPRHKTTANGNSIYNFKMAFLTLTLPVKQQHPTSFISSNLFNQFLTELRQAHNLENYVWRLEFQKNGNVHYHIACDTYLDFDDVKKRWNRILYNHGYVQKYQAKFSAMSLLDYYKYVSQSGPRDFFEVKKTYFKARASNWSQPPSVNIKSVVSSKKIANYISKYFGKDSKNAVVKNDLDTPENSENIRLWFCSRSLSKVGSVSDFCEAFKVDVRAIVESVKDVRKFFAKYATIIYFDLINFPMYCRQVLEPILRQHAYDTGYKPSF
jgi:hypothetical protein